MRSTRLALGWCLVCILAAPGCYESLTSIATPEKVVFIEDLVGEYKAIDPATGRLSIAKGERKAYRYTQYDAKDVVQNRGTLRIVKLGDNRFYEITVDGYKTVDGKPVYAIGRLKIEGKSGEKTLTGYAFKSKETLFDDPEVTSTEYSYKEEGAMKQSRALSMTPAKLQEYLEAHADEMSEPTLKFQKSRAGG